MVTYLSDDWVAALDHALTDLPAAVAADEQIAPCEMTVQYRVSDAPGGERAWFLELGPRGVRARPGRAPRPAVTFSQCWDVAVAVARGERAAPQAILAGDVRVSGDPTSLLAWRTVVQQAQDRVGELAARTEFARS